MYVVCAALKDSAEEMYFYYSLFLTTACTMNAFVLHLCRYMHMVQIKQNHTHSALASFLHSARPIKNLLGVWELYHTIMGICRGVHKGHLLPRLHLQVAPVLPQPQRRNPADAHAYSSEKTFHYALVKRVLASGAYNCRHMKLRQIRLCP